MKAQQLFSSLVTRIVVVGVLLVIAAGIGRYVVLAQVVRADLLRVSSQQQLALAGATAREIDYKLLERQRFLEAIAATLPQDLLAQPARLRPWLEERLRLQPLFGNGIVVLDLQGRALIDAPERPNRLGMSLADNVDFIAARGGWSGIGHPLYSRLTKVAILPFASPVRDAAGRVRAVLIAASPLDSPGFLDALQHERIGATGGFLLISPREHLFISADNPKLMLQPTPAPGVNALHDRAMQGFRGTDITVNAFGVEEIAAIASVPAAGWFLVARLPTAEALVAVRRTRSFIIGYSMIEMLIAALVIGLLTARVLRPLHVAAAHARRMTDGDAPLTPLAVAQDDEVGHLTNAFNQLILKVVQGQKRLEQLAHHDPLTGLYNRNIVTERVAHTLHRLKRSGHRAALLFVDLDGFKTINDELGHDAGDHVLKITAARLDAITRAGDTLARIGGDEFVLFIPDITSPAGGTEAQAVVALEAIAGKLIEAVSVPIDYGTATRSLGASVGIAISDGESTADALIAAADVAMYEAKRRGKQRFVLAQWGAGRAAASVP